jgi:hypothetical protein
MKTRQLTTAVFQLHCKCFNKTNHRLPNRHSQKVINIHTTIICYSLAIIITNMKGMWQPKNILAYDGHHKDSVCTRTTFQQSDKAGKTMGQTITTWSIKPSTNYDHLNHHHWEDLFFFFFFSGPVNSTECTAALGLLCCPSISFSTALITLCHVWRGTGPLPRLCLCPLVLQLFSQRHRTSVEPTPRIDKQCAALFQSPFCSICRLDLHQTG